MRLKYLDLRNNTDMNTVISSDLEQIWTPAFLFPNTKYGQRAFFKNEVATVAIEIINDKFKRKTF